MNLVGRYEAVRGLGPRGYSPPYILDRKRSMLLPRAGDEWWRSPEGIWIPTIAGGIGIQGARLGRSVMLGYINHDNMSFNTTALSSAYVAGTSGAAYAMRFLCPAAMTINNIYFFINSFTGTASLVDDINYEVRTGSSTAPTTTGGALIGSGTKNPSSTTGWINISGLSLALAAGYNYIIIGDTDGGATNFANCMRSAQYPSINQPGWRQVITTTANGWIATTVSETEMPVLVVNFSSGNPIGNAFTAFTNATSDTNRKGLLIDGLLAPLTVFGWTLNQYQLGFGPAISGIELYTGSPAPGSTPTASSTQLMHGSAGSVAGAQLATPATLAASTAYRFVFTYSSSTAYPRKLAIGTGVDATLRKAMAVGGGSWYYAYANGTTNWSNDDINAFPEMALLVDDQVAPAAAGGLMTHPGMAGGARG